MSMSNFVIREAILPALTATTKEEAIRQMVKSLQQAGYFRESEIEEIVAAVMRREQLGSTGIGRSIAIPHSRFGGVDRLIGTVAISQEGIPFDSIDGEPVHILILLVSPQDRPGDHLRALEAVNEGRVRAVHVRGRRRGRGGAAGGDEERDDGARGLLHLHWGTPLCSLVSSPPL